MLKELSSQYRDTDEMICGGVSTTDVIKYKELQERASHIVDSIIEADCENGNREQRDGLVNKGLELLVEKGVDTQGLGNRQIAHYAIFKQLAANDRLFRRAAKRIPPEILDQINFRDIKV